MTRQRQRRRQVARFGVLADPHYAEAGTGTRYCVDSLRKLELCADVFRAARVTMVVSLGDLVDSVPGRNDETRYLDAVLVTLARAGIEAHFVLGNHDVVGMTKREFLERASAVSLCPFYSFDSGGAHFVVLDGNCHSDGRDFAPGDVRWDESWISREQITWLRDDLGEGGGPPAIVLCHENLDQRGDGRMPDPYVARNATEVRAVIERSNRVAAVFQGHYHPGHVAAQNGIHYVTLTSVLSEGGPSDFACAVVTVLSDGAIEVDGYGRQQALSLGTRGAFQDTD